jgi:hypothetical protein
MALADSINDRDRTWLQEHLAVCAECKTQNEFRVQVVSALKSVSVSAHVDLVQSTRRRVRTLCLQQQRRSSKMRPIWISSTFASVWMACTAPYLWQSFDLTGHWLHIPDLLWQMGFLVTWFTPALTGAAVALWLRPQLTHAEPVRMVRAAT